MDGQQISNRRGSGSSRAEQEKLRRRTDYGKEVSARVNSECNTKQSTTGVREVYGYVRAHDGHDELNEGNEAYRFRTRMAGG